MSHTYYDIIASTNLHSFGGAYADRPASISDLNSQTLETIHTLIREDFGEDASDNFILFVNDLPDGRAETFVDNFERLWFHFSQYQPSNTELTAEKAQEKTWIMGEFLDNHNDVIHAHKNKNKKTNRTFDL